MIIIKFKKETISSRQLFFMVIGFTIGSSLVLPPGKDLGNKAWMAVILGLLEGLIFIAVYTNLAKKYNMKSYLGILKKVYGKVLGSIIFFTFILYCLHLSSLVLRNFMDFISTTMMPTTPIFVIGLAVSVTIVYAASKGIGVVGRTSEILVPLTFIAVFLTVVLLFKDMHIDYFKPFTQISIKQVLLSSHRAASFPFGETIAFILVLPLVKKKDKAKKAVMNGAILGALIIFIVITRNIAVLGVRGTVATYPSAQAVRQINILNVVTRLEVIIFFNLLTMGFIKAAVLLWCSARGVGELFNMYNYGSLVVPLSIVMLFTATFQFQNVMQNIEYANVYPYYAPIFQVGIPALTLLVAKIRKVK